MTNDNNSHPVSAVASSQAKLAPAVAIVGVSGFANRHYEILMELHAEGVLRIVAAAVINQTEESEKCRALRGIDCRIFDSFTEMLDTFRSKLDLCFIPTGIQHHCPMSVAAMEAGSNVYVEKPAAATIQDVHAMQECERRTQRFCAIGYQTIYGDETRWIKEAILGGEIGEIQAIKALALLPRPMSYYSRNSWAGNLRSGGAWVLDSPFNNAAAHQVNLLGYLAGPTFATGAKAASIFAELGRANPIKSPDTAHLSIRTTTGLSLDFYASHCAETARGPEVVVRGDRGEIVCATDEVSITREDGSTERRTPPDFRRSVENAIRAVVRRVRDSNAFICGLDIAEFQTLCANGAHESARIVTAPPELVTWENFENSTRAVIHGLDQSMIRAFEKEQTLVEQGISWLEPGRVVSLVGYDNFNGDRLEQE